MADLIRYDLLVQDAFRGLFRKVLANTAANGLPGDHHFYITFKTSAPGVVISTRLREQYPGEMTIILQHEFWDLHVDEKGFEVGLSFRQIPEKLGIPFSAVTAFFDPSVNFGAEFTVEEPLEQDVSDVSVASLPPTKTPRHARDKADLPPISLTAAHSRSNSPEQPADKKSEALATTLKTEAKSDLSKTESRMEATKIKPLRGSGSEPALVDPTEQTQKAEEQPKVVSIDAFRKKQP